VVALFSWVVLHVLIKAYGFVINNTKIMNMDKTRVTSSLLSSWLYINPKPEPIIATKQKLPNKKNKTQVDKE
jgi:hypothetical protein